MALDKLVDSAQLDADLASVADAIRAKGGTSAQLAFPAGFVSAVEAIETGGGGGDSGEVESTFSTLHWAIVTVGANSVSNTPALWTYLSGLAGVTGTVYGYWYAVINNPTPFYNMIAGTDLSSIGNYFNVWRYRNGTYSYVSRTSASYDAAVQSGMKYLVVWATGETPT